MSGGIIAIGPVGDVTISGNKLLRNDGNIYIYNVSGNVAKVSGNTTTDGNYGIIVDASTGVVVDKNAVASAAIAGLNAGPDAAANTFERNNLGLRLRRSRSRLPRRVEGQRYRGHREHVDEERRRHQVARRNLLPRHRSL